jgi:hypothetical protein
LLSATSEVSVDATGLETHYVSRYFVDRRRRPGRTNRFRRYFKLTVVADHRSHLILSAVVSRGPSNDAPGFLPAVEQARRQVRIRRLLGDAAYDAEEHHRRCRQDWKIPETIIPINHRGRPEATVSGLYRRDMQRNFPSEKYGRRWQVESVFSRTKRRLTPHLHARNNHARTNECLLLVITHNLMLLAKCWKKLSTEQLEA